MSSTINSSPFRRPTARTSVGSTPGRPVRSSSVVAPPASMSITSSTVNPISCPSPPTPDSPLTSSRMIVEPAASGACVWEVSAGGDAGGPGGAWPSARHPSTTVTRVPRTFTSPATTGGAPGIRVVGRRGRISRTWSTSAAHVSAPTRNTSKRAETRLPSVIGCEETKILQGVALGKQIRVSGRLGQRGTQLVRPFRCQGERGAGHRMRERQGGGMQQVPRRELLEALGLRPRGRRHAATAPEGVLAVADNRATDMREMHANLVRAAGAQPHAQQIAVREARHECRVRHGVAAAFRDRHSLALFRMASDRRFDIDHILAQMAPHERRVDALHGAALDRTGETPMRQIALRNEQQSRGVAIEAMDDAGPAFGRTAAGQLGAAPRQHVDEGVVPVAGTGMHDESCRLVEHGEMLVLVDEIQIGVERRVTAWRVFVRQLDRYFRPTFQDGRGAQRFAARGHAFIGDEASGLCAGESELVSEKPVETFRLNNHTKSEGQGSAARASFARCCARPSCHSESPSAIAPTVIAESATLNVGQRHAPMPTSTKSTTPCALRMRSMRLPTAPPQTSASATRRNRSPGRVPRTSEPRTTSATTARPRKIQRELSPTWRPNAAPSL